MKKMVRELVLFSLVAFAAIGMLTAMVALESSTGAYSYSGGGRWYYGAGRAQMQPDEACVYVGCTPVTPINVFSNEFGTVLSMCRCGGELKGVPLTQTVVVPTQIPSYIPT
ncbi:MAG TPA: hypothetical protein VI612_00925 [Candidatus Nanoarchaeia archaeon]|nr:hypothetical protein [Candidatus Nanoarchaeia archaeon]